MWLFEGTYDRISPQWEWLNIKIYYSEIPFGGLKWKFVINFLSIKCTSTNEENYRAFVWEDTLS